MKNIQKILELFPGRDSIRIENAPYMALSIERIGEGPHGLPAVSVCHYGEQNGDLMRDPEMCFEIDAAGNWHPYYFRNDYTGTEQNVYFTREDGAKMVRPTLKRELASFARIWNRNLGEQDFVKAAKSLLATEQAFEGAAA